MLKSLKKKNIAQKDKDASKVNKPCSAQTFIEYVIVLSLVGAVLITMTPFIQRSIQAMIKLVADQIGNQENGDQYFSDRTGHMRKSDTFIKSKATIKKDQLLGNTIKIIDTVTYKYSNADMNLGFTKGEEKEREEDNGDDDQNDDQNP